MILKLASWISADSRNSETRRTAQAHVPGMHRTIKATRLRLWAVLNILSWLRGISSYDLVSFCFRAALFDATVSRQRYDKNWHLQSLHMACVDIYHGIYRYTENFTVTLSQSSADK